MSPQPNAYSEARSLHSTSRTAHFYFYGKVHACTGAHPRTFTRLALTRQVLTHEALDRAWGKRLFKLARQVTRTFILLRILPRIILGTLLRIRMRMLKYSYACVRCALGLGSTSAASVSGCIHNDIIPLPPR